MAKAMRLKFTLGALMAANLISGCKSSATQSTEEGLAIHTSGPISRVYGDINDHLNDPQLDSLASSFLPISLWFVPKYFGGEDLHVCVFASNEFRPGTLKGNIDESYDLDRFSRSKALKGGKYINWSTLFQVLNEQKNSGKWNPNITETFSKAGEMLKAEKDKLKQSLVKNLEDMTVVQPLGLMKISGVDFYYPDPQNNTPESILAGLLLTLDKTETTGNDCPSTETLYERAKAGGDEVVLVQPAKPVQVNLPECKGDQRLVHHNVNSGWRCEGKGAWEQYQKHCDQQPGFGFYRIDPNGSVTDRDNWNCVKP
jgi:hypothetical protein